jgi:hypothetical protein
MSMTWARNQYRGIIQETRNQCHTPLLYQTNDGRTRVECRFAEETLWLSQALIAELFQTTPQNITLHLKALYTEGELEELATCKEYLQVRQEGGREVRRSVKHYNLDAILAVGYRVRSDRGAQFRRWATARRRELAEAEGEHALITALEDAAKKLPTKKNRK